MSRYYVHTLTDDDGDHEVHKSTCSRLPKPGNMADLGVHSNCASAVTEAERRGFKPADGCAHCSETCHTS
ncbi:MAG TPA: hypothetical protein VJ964_02735 [Balneolaceae bacterium]|nr:hypothetical protein [Balneolaceae bacterium]